MARPTALITGASAGLGREYARRFAADGHDLVLVARRRDRLEALAGELCREHGIEVRVIAEDLSDPGAPGRIQAELRHAGIAIEALVNNAGLGAFGAVLDQPLERQLQMIQVNVVALVALTRRLAPDMVERGRGRILNVGSVAAFQPGPGHAVYYATKAFVLPFSEALAHELRDTGVTVTVTSPGSTRTEFQAVSGKPSRGAWLEAEAGPVAAHGYAAMRRGEVVSIPGLGNRMTVAAVRLLPRAWVRRAAGWLNAGPGEPPPED